MKKFVLTGGPGAGKTALLDILGKMICSHSVIIPESASILFKGGFWRLPSESAKLCAQRAIFQIQREQELLVQSENKWQFAYCDRGTLDGLAYWPGTAESFFKELQTDLKTELKKYDLVLHLRSPSLSLGYNHSNPVRVESVEEAQAIDLKIEEIWKTHPNYYQIQSSQNFLQKVQKALLLLKNFQCSTCHEGA
jgi:predicted ATPase